MKTFIFLILLFSSFLSHGDIFHKTKIDLVYPWSDGNFMIGIATENKNCNNRNGFYRVYVGFEGVTESGANKIYSAALAAAAQQKDVEIIFNPSADNQCYISRIKTFY